MSVPDNTTFNFQDVSTEIYGDVNAGRNLVSAFADAISWKFDPAYSGSKNSLYNFRNYGTGTTTTSTSSSTTTTTTTLPLEILYIQFPNLPNDAAGEMTVATYVTGTLTERGICFNTAGSPTKADGYVVQANTTGAITTIITSGLTSSSYYYFSAYAINTIETIYYPYPTHLWIN